MPQRAKRGADVAGRISQAFADLLAEGYSAEGIGVRLLRQKASVSTDAARRWLVDNRPEVQAPPLPADMLEEIVTLVWKRALVAAREDLAEQMEAAHGEEVALLEDSERDALEQLANQTRRAEEAEATVSEQRGELERIRFQLSETRQQLRSAKDEVTEAREAAKAAAADMTAATARAEAESVRAETMTQVAERAERRAERAEEETEAVRSAAASKAEQAAGELAVAQQALTEAAAAVQAAEKDADEARAAAAKSAAEAAAATATSETLRRIMDEAASRG